MNPRISAALAVVVVVASVTGVTAFATPAAAQSGDESVLGGVLGEEMPSVLEDPRGYVEAILSGIAGASDRLQYLASENTPSFLGLQSGQTAAEEARAVSSYFNENNATLIEYANARGNWSENHTVELVWNLDGETSTRYLVANATDGNLTRAEIVTSTDRTVDHDVELCGYAAASSREALEHFATNYAEPGEDVTASYRARLAGKYAKNVETSLYPSEGDCDN